MGCSRQRLPVAKAALLVRHVSAAWLTVLWQHLLQLVWAAGNSTGTALTADDFYSNTLVMNYYKNYVSFILNHVNKKTGLPFKVHAVCQGALQSARHRPPCCCCHLSSGADFWSV